MLVPPTDPVGRTPLMDVRNAVPLVRHALRSRTTASASTRASAGGNEAPPTRGTVGRVTHGECEMRTFQGYSAIPSHMLFSGSSCNIAPLMLNASSFDECEAACLAQPLCKAVSWVTHSHRRKQSRGRCVGRSSVDATWMRLTDPDASHVYGGVRHCSGCGVQHRLDALCRDLAANGTDGRCVGGAAVARNARTFNGFDKGEDFAWMCYPTVPPGANVALACVDGGGSMTACGMHEANEPCQMAVSPIAELHDEHRSGCGVPGCLASAGSTRLVPPQPHASPPPPHPPATPPSWVPATAAEVAERVRALADAGYLNCTRQHDELQNKCSATRTDFGWLRWAWDGDGAQPRRQLSPAGTALSWWLRTTSVEADGPDAFDPLQFVEAVAALGDGMRERVVAFAGDSTARQQAVSLCCLLHAATTVGAPFRVAITFSEPFGAVRCRVDGTAHTLLVVRYNRFNRADALDDGRPSQMHPTLHPTLARVILQAPEVLVVNLGEWEFEDGCEDMHSLHDTLAPLRCGRRRVAWRHWILSSYARKLGLLSEALETAYPAGSAKRANSLVVLRTGTPRDYVNGTMRQGGTCVRRVPLTAAELARDEAAPEPGGMRFAVMSKNAMLIATAAQRLPWVRVLDAYGIAAARVDAHPGAIVKAGGRKAMDCLHNCLPGVPDVYNGHLLTLLATRAAGNIGQASSLLARRGFQHSGRPFVHGSPPDLALQFHPEAPPTRLECAPASLPEGVPLVGVCSALSSNPPVRGVALLGGHEQYHTIASNRSAP